MRDHTKLLAFELADEVAMVVYRVGPKVVETEKVLNGLIRALRDNSEPSAYSLNTLYLYRSVMNRYRVVVEHLTYPDVTDRFTLGRLRPLLSTVVTSIPSLSPNSCVGRRSPHSQGRAAEERRVP